MNKNKLKAKLLAEADRYVPNVKEQIKGQIYFNRFRQKSEKSKAKRKWYFIAAPIATLLIAATVLTFALAPFTKGGGGGGTIPSAFSETVVRIDVVNPSVKFNVNADGVVTKQAPCNRDGAVLLLKKDFVGYSIEKAAVEVVQLAGKYGYLVDAPNRVIALKVLNDNADTERQMAEKIKLNVSAQVLTLAPQVEIALAGKNEVLSFLIEVKKYDRERAEKLSAEEMEDIIDSLMEDSEGEELDEYIERVANGMRGFLQSRYDAGAAMLNLLKGYADVAERGDVNLSVADKLALKAFIALYSVECDIKNFEVIDGEDFLDFLEELEEEQEEILESVAELDEDKSEISDILEDWYDQYKLFIKNHKP